MIHMFSFLNGGLYNFKPFLDHSQNVDHGSIENRRRQIINKKIIFMGKLKKMVDIFLTNKKILKGTGAKS
jgi:hypothetical protein